MSCLPPSKKPNLDLTISVAASTLHPPSLVCTLSKLWAGVDCFSWVLLVCASVSSLSPLPERWLVRRTWRHNKPLLHLCASISSSVSHPSSLQTYWPLTFHSSKVASSWGPVAWVVTGELFPLKVRAKALSMTTATNWLLNFAIAYATPYMVDEDEGNLQSRVFFVWGSCCFVCIAFVYLMIYETKGLSLEQVDELYGIVTKAWKSREFRPQVSFQDVEEMDAAGRKMSMQDMADATQRKRSTGSAQVEKV